jgi:TPR repeat protein
MEAEEWYEKAAQKGDKQALHYLNVLRRQPAYRVESKPTIDDKWDLQWTAKTASYGDMQSQFELGKFYAEGRKIQMDYTLAAQWYEKAAVQGHEEAMTSLGALYLDGKGVSSSIDNALFWYNQAALRDYIPAQQKLYEIYIKDDEKTQDLVKAASWLYISLTFLFPDEKDLTKVSPQLEELWNKFTQEQKEEVLFFVYSFIDKVRKK